MFQFLTSLFKLMRKTIIRLKKIIIIIWNHEETNPNVCFLDYACSMLDRLISKC